MKINSDFWKFFLSLKIPPNFLCTPLYFYSLFLCFSLLYFCTFFPCFFFWKFPLIFIFVTHFPSDFVHIYFCYYCWKPSNKNLCYLKIFSCFLRNSRKKFSKVSRKNRRQGRMCEVSPNKIFEVVIICILQNDSFLTTFAYFLLTFHFRKDRSNICKA